MGTDVTEGSSQQDRVALVIDELTFELLGPVVQHLAVGLIDFVSRVWLITPAARATGLSLGPVHVLSYKPSAWLGWRRVASRILEAFGNTTPNVIHAFSHRANPLARELASSIGCPLVCHLLARGDLKTRFRADRGSGYWIAASAPLLAEAEKRRFIRASGVTLIRPGLLAAASPACFAREGQTPSILCMSSFEASAGVERLIRAVKKLVSEGLNLMLFLLANGAFEKRLRQLVAAEGLIKNVTFGPPLLNWTTAMRAADLFVVPGVEERVDVHLLHALAAGTAAVSCATPCSDFMVHEQTGLICLEPSTKCLAEAIRRLLVDRSLAQKLASNALQHCKQFHSLSNMAEQTAAVYARLRSVKREGHTSFEKK